MSELTDKEKKDFHDMIIACGRTPDDFVLSLSAATGDISVSNKIKNRQRDYVRDNKGAWVLSFATDLKMGEI